MAARTCLTVKDQGDSLEKYKVQQEGGSVLRLGKPDLQLLQHHEGAEFYAYTHSPTPTSFREEQAKKAHSFESIAIITY